MSIFNKRRFANFQRKILVIDFVIQVVATIYLYYLCFGFSMEANLVPRKTQYSGLFSVLLLIYFSYHFIFQFVSNILEMIIQRNLVKIRLLFALISSIVFANLSLFLLNGLDNQFLSAILLISTFLAYPILTFFNLWLVSKK